jgi:hypothetical protein
MKTPWHVWVVGLVAILWNGYGCYVYYLTVTGDPAYLDTLTADQRAAYEAMPTLYYALFALAVWGSLTGSILLILRMKLSTPVFMISLASVALSYIYSFFIADVSVSMGTMEIMLTIAVIAIAVFLLIYSRSMAKAGVLK